MLSVSMMGVTLERVQNKFACIIGELCSEPVVLSQFAIWLDLRLAEYKAKGAISLECTGEHPDPLWLKGHKSAPERIKENEVSTALSPHADPRNSFSSTITTLRPSFNPQHIPDSLEDRLSPDVVVVVKEEPSESIDDVGVFPVALHRHDDTNMNRRPVRKRTATDSISSEHNLHKQSPKARRVTSSCESETPTLTLEPVSESLMSIISGDLEEQKFSQNISTDYSMGIQEKGDLSGFQFSTQPLASTSQGAGHTVGEDVTEIEDGSSINDSAEALHPTNSAISLPVPPTSVHGTNKTILSVGRPPISAALMEDLRCLYPSTFPERLTSASIKARFPNRNIKSPNSVRDMVKCVGILERWMWGRYGEERDVERIPPKELDEYLSDFYPVLRKQDGELYDPRTLANFRSHLVCFLHDCGYKFSISKSQEFAGSQVVFTHMTKAITCNKMSK